MLPKDDMGRLSPKQIMEMKPTLSHLMVSQRTKHPKQKKKHQANQLSAYGLGDGGVGGEKLLLFLSEDDDNRGAMGTTQCPRMLSKIQWAIWQTKILKHPTTTNKHLMLTNPQKTCYNFKQLNPHLHRHIQSFLLFSDLHLGHG